MQGSVRTALLAAAWLAGGPVSAQIVEYYHLDGLGNVRAITDAAGNVTERHDYLPFGEECTTGPCATNPGVGAGQPRKFTGKERDQETGLDYFGARYYGSKMGRFTTVDPVVNIKASLLNPQRWNRYSYSLNSPIRFNDPDGREVPVVIDNKLYNMGLEGKTTGSVAEGNRAFGGLILGTTTALFGPEMLAAGAIAAQACLFSASCLGALQETAEGLAGGPPRPGPASIGAQAERSVALTAGQEANLARFSRKLPSGSTGTYVDELGEQILFTAEVPGHVPGSKAVYQKAVNAAGETTSYVKTTVDPRGNVVHVKDKLGPN